MNEFRVAWMFPDTLFLHGERGNLLALARYARMAGLTPTVDKVDFSTEGWDPWSYDVLFFGPGEISSFSAVAEWLQPYTDDLAEFIAQGGPIIVTGTSVGLFCEKTLRADGTEVEGLGLLYATFKENEDVYGDDEWFSCIYNGKEMEIIGNQIQMGDLELVDENPFGKLLYGYGNTGKNREEGIIKNNSIFTNALGPVLVTNPWLTEEIIRVCIFNRGYEEKDFGYDMELEHKSFESKKRLITTKETRLTNCPREKE